jgi:hypothetical protein
MMGAILGATKVSSILKGKSCHGWLWSGDVKQHLTNFGGGNSWFCTSLMYSMVNACPDKCRTRFCVPHVMPFLISFEPATSQEKN